MDGHLQIHRPAWCGMLELQVTHMPPFSTPLCPLAPSGIFNDQRPVLVEPHSMSRLVHLTSLASSGLAQPLLPQPNITSLCSLRVAGAHWDTHKGGVLTTHLNMPFV